MIAHSPACLRRENSYGLVSLWDLIMKLVKPEEILQIARDLWVSGMVLSPVSEAVQRDAAITILKMKIQECADLCKQFDLRVSALKVEDMRKIVGLATATLNGNEVGRMSQMVSQTMAQEMSLQLYFQISSEKADHFADGVEPFGSEVADSFPSTTFDAGEARRCFALSRNTACVFHLMRVLEIGLRTLAEKFNVPTDQANWEQMINKIEKAITEIEKDPNRPANWRDEREFYSQCVSHFRVVKDAWRNYTAHARGKYDEQEALDMLGNVRGFMQKLATRLREPV